MNLEAKLYSASKNHLGELKDVHGAIEELKYDDIQLMCKIDVLEQVFQQIEEAVTLQVLYRTTPHPVHHIRSCSYNCSPIVSPFIGPSTATANG